jgi:SpoIVB peptidase S55.
MKLKFFAVSLLIFAFCASIFGQTSSQKNASATAVKTSNVPILPLSQVKEGMRGTARTVFRGSEPEDFNVEILGVVPGAIGPKQDLIIGKISGGQADRTFVFQGMSGSPVYVDGKLVGAISYSFPFAKEPICGITPVEQMIKIFEQNAAPKNNQPRAFSFAELASTEFKPQFPQGSAVAASVVTNSSVPNVAGQAFQRIGTPIAFSGFTQETLNLFAPQLASVGLTPVAAIGGGAKITPLEKYNEKTLQGGASVTMQLVRGDYSMSAAGTVTFRDGEKIYAFGHPFLNLGISDLPMSESTVVTVVPNVNNSFKLAVPTAMVGTMTQDRNTGVFGQLGKAPKMIPVKLNLQTSRGQTETLDFEIARDDFLTPLLLNMAVYNSITANERGLGDSTIKIEGLIKLKNQEPVKVERRFTGAQATQLASGAVAIPVNQLLRSGFDETEISEITMNVTSFDGTKSAVLERIALDRSEVKPGETFEVHSFIRTNTGQVFVQRTPITIPKDTPAGTLLVSVGDGNSLQQISPARAFVPKNLGELVKTINQVKKNDRLYAQTYRVTNGAIIGAKEMPNLPPSVLATLNNDRTAGGFTPTVLTVLTEQEIEPAEYVISGQQVLTIEVVR